MAFLYSHQIDKLRADTTPEYLAEIYRLAPAIPELNRNRKSLYDQFIYRFNHSPEHRAMYAVVEFGVQSIFQLIAVSREIDFSLTSHGDGSPLAFRHECFLDLVASCSDPAEDDEAYQCPALDADVLISVPGAGRHFRRVGRPCPHEVEHLQQVFDLLEEFIKVTISTPDVHD